MNNNKDYANLLGRYADIIGKPDYSLSNEQKEMIKSLGESILERTEDVYVSHCNRSDKKTSTKKIVENSRVETLRKSKAGKKLLVSQTIKLAKDIGKEPGE